MQAFAEQLHAPAHCLALQQVGDALRLADDEFEHVPGLLTFDAAGRPSAISSPAPIIPRRLHCSDSSRQCVVTTIAVPPSASLLIMVQNARRARGSTPEVGSSRRRMSGSCRIVQRRRSRAAYTHPAGSRRSGSLFPSSPEKESRRRIFSSRSWSGTP